MKFVNYSFFLVAICFSAKLFGQNKTAKTIEVIKQECYNTSLKDFDNSIALAIKGQEISLKENDSVSYAFFERFMGSAFYFKGNYTKASYHYFKSIKILESYDEKTELGLSYNELAKLYRKTKKLNLAKETYDKALVIFTELKDSTYISMINNESGVVFEYEGNYNEALKRYTTSFHISEALNDSVAISYALNNIAGLYTLQNKFELAERFLMKALTIRKQLKDSFALAINYSDLGSNSISDKKNQDAIRYIDTSNYIAKKLHYVELQSQNYLKLSEAYEKNGDLALAYLNYKIYISLKDSVFTKESENLLNELNTKYQTEKKDLELAKNKADIIIEKNKRYFTYIALAFFMVLCSIAIWAFYQKKKSATLLLTKNSLLQQANELITHQKEEISEKQKEILDSINYAQKIQRALLASEEMLFENSLNHFILFKPKDIVSGDFTWATKINNYLFLACCDSTGHGIPGAFMSLLNIGFLSEAVKERAIFEPGEIFNYVRDRLIETIGKDKQQDGFDGILLRIDLNSKLIAYSAANNSPLLIRNETIINLSCNKMPVGKGIKTESFSTFILDYQKNDTLYLYTDGYADQFGGPKGKKFKYKPFENLLLQNVSNDLLIQKETINTEFENWRGELEQVDDVCVVGIKL